MLSQVGRVTLLKHVMQSVPIYYMGAQSLPKLTINRLEGTMRRFLWGKLHKTNYLAYTAWDKICLEKDEGGLRLRKLETLNEAILGKALWTLLTNTHSI
jgi:hypothetical protein